MYVNLREFVGRLEREGELARVGARVDAELEIAELTDREAKRAGGGRALLFEDTATGFPVATNIMGSARRMAMALGVSELGEIERRLGGLFAKAFEPMEGLGAKMRVVPLLGEMAGWMPRKARGRGECQQVRLEGGLERLPILKCRPHDGGRFVTLPLVHTVDPETGARNLGMYRMQVTGAHTTGMHWHVHKTGERHYRAWQRRGGPMPVTVCLGGDPVYTYAATAPLPDGVDEYLLAGFLRRRAVRLVKCLTNDLWVPADCDFVIEGYVDTAQPKFREGPFGDHTGFYSLEDDYPEFHVTCITHRRDAIYPATLVGVPPQEDFYMAQATERIFLAPIRAVVQPEVTDMWMPAAGVAHNLALVAIDKSYEGQAFKVASAMWGAGQMMFNKALAVMPADAGLRDIGELARRVRNADMERDAMFGRGVSDVLDHATATPGEGGKVALDLTPDRSEKRPHTRCGFDAPTVSSYPDLSAAPTACPGADIDTSLTAEWGLVVARMDPDAEFDAEALLRGAEDVNFLVIADAATRGLSPAELLWHVAGNTDPARDMRLCGATMVVDGRTKSAAREGWPARVPNVVVAAPQTIALVDARWPEYGLGEFVPSPSLKYAPLVWSDRAEV